MPCLGNPLCQEIKFPLKMNLLKLETINQSKKGSPGSTDFSNESLRQIGDGGSRLVRLVTRHSNRQTNKQRLLLIDIDALVNVSWNLHGIFSIPKF